MVAAVSPGLLVVLISNPCFRLRAIIGIATRWWRVGAALMTACDLAGCAMGLQLPLPRKACAISRSSDKTATLQSRWRSIVVTAVYG